MLRRARRANGPIREGSYVVTLASPRADLVGVLALVDPEGTAGEREHIALEHGATVLAVELARVRAVTDSELRLGRDLVDDLLAGLQDERTIARAQGVGYDLFRPHRVIVLSVDDDDGDREELFHAVRRVARDLEVGSLLGVRDSSIVLLADADRDWDRMRREVGRAEGGRCRVGVGDICTSPSDVPRSYREAQLALRVQRATGGVEQVTTFNDLGVFHILAESEDFSAIDRFVEHWLGALREYDSEHHGALVETLTRHLDGGGSYDATANALSAHRNTVKYRLRRIQEISGFDLADPDTRFNLQLASRALQTLEALEP
jgi:DNA-binding PucR family transcriptional regulator